MTFILFFSLVLLVWTGLHVHVGMHLSGLHVITDKRLRLAIRIGTGVLWLMLPLTMAGTLLKWQGMATSLGLVAVTWLGILFLLFACLLVIDVLTLGGKLFVAHTRWLRLWAVIVGCGLSIVALIQGHRDPIVVPYEVKLPGLPAERDGLRLLVLTDLHLGTQIGEDWLARLSTRVDELKPDAIVIVGDLVDRDASLVMPMIPALSKLRAPLGVWAVQGNHDTFSNTQLWEQIVTEAGFRKLRNESALLVPGLRLVGVDDVGIMGRKGEAEQGVAKAFGTTQPAAGTAAQEGVIYLSHTPDLADLAERNGAGLMLSGHTHNGQIWPFKYLVALRHSYLHGEYTLGDMTIIVSAGAGLWGPRMRLWGPGEMPLLTLRAKGR